MAVAIAAQSVIFPCQRASVRQLMPSVSINPRKKSRYQGIKRKLSPDKRPSDTVRVPQILPQRPVIRENFNLLETWTNGVYHPQSPVNRVALEVKSSPVVSLYPGNMECNFQSGTGWPVGGDVLAERLSMRPGRAGAS